MKKQLLSGIWQLYGYSDKNPILSSENIKDCDISIAGKVPGDVMLDLSENGFLPKDIFMGMNTTKTYDFEGYGWWYRTSFKKSEDFGNDRLFLRFEGVDCIADYYLNGIKIGSSDNMYVAHEFDVTKVIRDENVLEVHISSAMLDAYKHEYKAFSLANHRENHYLETAYIRKAAHCFGWDIFPRIVTAGIFKDVYLVQKDECRVNQLFCYT